MSKMSQCSYKIKYFDYEKRQPINFECSENASGSGLCIFHDKNSSDDNLELQLIEKTKSLSKKEPLICIGYNIPKINIAESFSSPVYFTRAFIKDANFSGAKFQNVDFSGTIFQNANFSGVTFENADFLATKFNKTSNFSNIVVKNKVNFSESIFNDADFNSSSLKKAQFIGTKFVKADFSLAIIEDSDFFGANFEKEALFVGTQIKRTRFPKAVFKNRAHFTGASLAKTNFHQCNFNLLNMDHVKINVAVFQGSTFHGSVNFSSSELEKVDFFGTNFKKNVNFSESDLQEVSFSQGGILGKSNFVKTEFKQGTKFIDFRLNECDFTQAKFTSQTNFHKVNFKNQDKVNFDVDNLGNVSFRNTDISKIKFGEEVKWGGNDNFTIVDEAQLENSNQTQIESVIAIYRNLRKNYKNRFRDEESNKFLLKEIALTKKYYKDSFESNEEEKETLEKKLSELKELCNVLENQIKDIKELNNN